MIVMPIPILNTEKRVTNNQSTQQIIDYLCIAIADSQKDFPALKRMFNGKTKMETLQNIYDYSQNNFRYYKEPPSKQDVRTAARVMNDKVIDCKGFSTFILASCLSNGIPAKFRLASYNYFDKTPTHVYVVANVNGKDVVLDGTIKSFDNEHPYKHIQDVKPKINPMALNYLQGIDDIPVMNGRAERKERRSARKEKRQERREDRKETREEKKERRQERREERGSLVARIGAAPARGAFLMLLKLNGLKVATKMARAWKNDQSKVASFWAKFGGKLPDLKKAIEQGSKAALNEQTAKGMGAVTMTAALATATPIMIAVSTLIKQLGLFDGKEDETAFDEGIEDGIDFLETDPNITKEFADLPNDDEVFAYSRSGSRKALAPKSAAEGEGMDTTTMVMIGAAVLVGGYLLLSKK